MKETKIYDLDGWDDRGKGFCLSDNEFDYNVIVSVDSKRVFSDFVLKIDAYDKQQEFLYKVHEDGFKIELSLVYQKSFINLPDVTGGVVLESNIIERHKKSGTEKETEEDVAYFKKMVTWFSLDDLCSDMRKDMFWFIKLSILCASLENKAKDSFIKHVRENKERVKVGLLKIDKLINELGDDFCVAFDENYGTYYIRKNILNDKIESVFDPDSKNFCGILEGEFSRKLNIIKIFDYFLDGRWKDLEMKQKEEDNLLLKTEKENASKPFYWAAVFILSYLLSLFLDINFFLSFVIVFIPSLFVVFIYFSISYKK